MTFDKNILLFLSLSLSLSASETLSVNLQSPALLNITRPHLINNGLTLPIYKLIKCVGVCANYHCLTQESATLAASLQASS